LFLNICVGFTDVEIHPEIGKHFWDAQHWPKHILARYTWLVLFDLQLFLSFSLSMKHLSFGGFIMLGLLIIFAILFFQ